MDFDSTNKIEDSSPNKNIIPLNPTPHESNSRNKSPKPISNSDSNSKNSNNSIQNSSNLSFTDLPNALICEVLKCLDPKELGLVSCVSNHLNSLVSEDHHSWKKLYFDRWGPPPSTPVDSQLDTPSWKETFVEREFHTRSFIGRFFVDTLRGHTEPVRAVCILKPVKLIFTGGYDCAVRMWDLEEGFCLGSSRSLGCTIRAIKADMGLLIVAGTDAFIHCWYAVKGNPNLFYLNGNQNSNLDNSNFEFRLWGHEGPITCLDLDSKNIYSGSWDMTVRVWDRVSRKCIMKMTHQDWVWDIAPRGATLAVTAGTDLYIWGISNGEEPEPLQYLPEPHKGSNAYSLARTNLGDLVFSGGEDGTIHMYDLTRLNSKGDLVISTKWAPHSSAINALSFEYPWLVSCSNDGRVALIDIRNLLDRKKNCRGRIVGIEPPHRMLHGFGGNIFAVDLGMDRIVCGGEGGVVRVWNFSEALERERRARLSRNARVENRMRRKKIQMEMMSSGGTGGGGLQSPVAKSGGVWHTKKGVGGKLKG